MFETIEQARLQALHIFCDDATQLRAIVAIHNTRLGPALGGCRFLPYPSDTHAIEDAIRLAQGMSYKAALAGLPLGGGKAVILKPHPLMDRAGLLQSFGRFIEQLNGLYITSVDSGTNSSDMDEIAKSTQHVTATRFSHIDPSPNTARGVLYGIQAALIHRYGHDSLNGVHVAIQGVGNVGASLARQLHEHGAKLTLSDCDLEKAKRLAAPLNAKVVSPDDIIGVPCDVFAPCGLGGVLNDNTLPQLRCHIVAGAANNQLANPEHDIWLHQHDILYAPDYVINAGGLIQVASEKVSLLEDGNANHANLCTYNAEFVSQRTLKIRDTLLKIFRSAAEQHEATGRVANRLAEHILFPKPDKLPETEIAFKTPESSTFLSQHTDAEHTDTQHANTRSNTLSNAGVSHLGNTSCMEALS